MGFSEFFTVETATRIFKESCKRAKPGADRVTASAFEVNLESEILSIQRKITERKYKFTRFEVALKVKRHDKLPRLLFKSTIRDRLTAKMMCEYFHTFYRAKEMTLTDTRDAVLDRIAKLLQTKDHSGAYIFRYFFRLDLSNYFDSINRAALCKKLAEDGIDSEFLFLLEKLFFTMDKSIAVPNGKGVPQGLSISSLLAERYICDLDKHFTAEVYKNKVALIRYVDDIIVFTCDKDTLSSARDSLVFSLRSEYGLQLNQDKITAGDLHLDRFDFLGVTIDDYKLKISERQNKKVADQMENIFRWYKRIQKTKRHPLSSKEERLLNSLLERLNLFITGYYYRNSKDNHFVRYGWILTSIPKQIADIEALKHLDGFADHLIEKYIDSSSGKAYLRSRRKSFYQVYIINKYTKNEKGYILDRDRIEKDIDKMYSITCNLSHVDVKYELDYHVFDKDRFESAVNDTLPGYFAKTLYIANRSLTTDILY